MPPLLISSASVRTIPFKATVLRTFAERNPVRLLAKTQLRQSKGLDSDGGKWIATWLNYIQSCPALFEDWTDVPVG